MALRELGRRMVDGGAFDEVEDFGMLRKDELDEFLADPSAFDGDDPDAAQAVQGALRRSSRRSCSSASRPSLAWPRRDARSTSRSASPGDVAASACRAARAWPRAGRGSCSTRTIPTALEPGDVLVAPITDPSWTPLFVPAAAVVVDVGAPLSHAIIVSRELGIPCVVSATGATRAIPDGAMVRGRRRRPEQ